MTLRLRVWISGGGGGWGVTCLSSALACLPPSDLGEPGPPGQSYMNGEGLWAALVFQAPRLPLQLTHSSIVTGQQISYSQNAGVIIANSGEVILIAVITSSDVPGTHSGHQTLCQGCSTG